MPRYFQLYFYDTDHELDNRMSVLQDANLSKGIMSRIRSIMVQNPYARFILLLKDYTSFQDLQLCIAGNASLNQRVYKKPSLDQVVAI